MGPYGTSLVNAPFYTHILAIGAGTGIVPCISLLKEHVRKMLMMEPENYLVNTKEDEKRSIAIRDAKESKERSIAQHIVSRFIGSTAKEPEQVWTDAPQRGRPMLRPISSVNKSKRQQDNIQERYATWRRMHICLYYHYQPSPYPYPTHFLRMRLSASTRGDDAFGGARAVKLQLKLAVFDATKSIYRRTCQLFVTIYGVTVFSLCLSWTLTTAAVGSSMVAGLEIATLVLHGVFFIAAFFLWVAYDTPLYYLFEI